MATTPSFAHARRPLRHAIVERASTFFRNHAAEGVRIIDVSRAAGVSERWLRAAFRQEFGLSPKQFDVHERLDAARRTLSDARTADSVTTVATRYGFFELGRFAVMYKRLFGESPSETLRAHRVSRARST